MGRIPSSSLCGPGKYLRVLHASSLLKCWASSVLGLMGMELMFFTADCTMPCFRFLTKTVLVMHKCFSSCRTGPTRHQGLHCFSLYDSACFLAHFLYFMSQLWSKGDSPAMLWKGRWCNGPVCHSVSHLTPALFFSFLLQGVEWGSLLEYRRVA